MAALTLHQILFTAAKTINPLLIVAESYSVIWPKHQNSSDLIKVQLNQNLAETNRFDRNQATSKTLFTHTILLVASMVAFMTSLRTVQASDQAALHRSQFLRSLFRAVLVRILYLYLMNLLTGQEFNHLGSSFFGCLIHSGVILILTTFLLSVQSTIGSLGDSLTIHHCISKHQELSFSSPLSDVRYQFVTYLMWGSTSLAFTCMIVCELSIGSFITSRIPFSNVSLGFGVLALVTEFILMNLLTKDGQKIPTDLNQAMKKTSKIGKKTNYLRCWPIERMQLHLVSVNGVRDLPESVMSISTHHMNRSSTGEMLHIVDEEEWDTTILNWFRRPEQRQPKSNSVINKVVPQHRFHIYDRSKFSLYDGFDTEFMSYSVKDHIVLENFHENKPFTSDFNQIFDIINVIMLDKELYFIQQIVMLLSIGVIYQANQLRFLTDYLHFIAHLLSPEICAYFLDATRSIVGMHITDYRTMRIIAYISLLCGSLFAQSLARLIWLHFISLFTSKLGTRSMLICSTILSLSYPIQLTLNLKLAEAELNLEPQFQAVLLIFQLFLIQLQIGFIGASLDYVINELALRYDQGIDKQKLTWLGTNKSVHCTIHCILSGSFNLVSISLVSGMSLAQVIINRLLT